MEVDTYTVGAFNMALGLPYAVAIGNTYRVRRDCTKKFSYCKDIHANTLMFRGENLIPVDGTAMVPAAEIKRA